MDAWTSLVKPADLAETRLIDAILEGVFPVDSNLPPERDLAVRLGVTRPTLRETLQRLARDGWVEIHQGRPTRVRNYLQEGNLAVLGAMARHIPHLPQDFVPNLLAVRLVLAPAYTRLAIERSAAEIADRLTPLLHLEDQPKAYAQADWELHRALTLACGNPIYPLILNGFCDLYPPMAVRYFQSERARHHSFAFYSVLQAAAKAGDSIQAETIMRQVMTESLAIWQEANPVNETGREEAERGML